MDQHAQTTNKVVDGAAGLAGLVSPLWLQYVEHGLEFTMLVGGIALLAIRLALSVREWRKENDKK